MKASHIAILLLIFCVATLVLLGTLGLYTQGRNATSLQDAITASNRRVEQLATELEALRVENARLERLRDEMVHAAQLAQAADAARSNSQAVARPVPPQSFQARTFAGDKFIGLSWVVPSNLTEDKESGQVRFEPVILLGDHVRNAITQTRTNFVDREVVNNSTYHQHYGYQPPYWYGYPYWIYPESPIFTNPPPSPVPRPSAPGNGPTPPGAVGRVVPPKPVGSR